MAFRVEIKNSAKSDLKKLKNSHLKSEFLAIVGQLKVNPFKNNQGFEKLKPPVLGKYSRRINNQHRVVYKVDKRSGTVSILAAWSHYQS